jgi:hypothetical protein
MDIANIDGGIMSRKKNLASSRNDAELRSGAGLRKGNIRSDFSLFGVSCEGIDTALAKRHLLLLVIIAIIAEFAIVFFTTSLFHSFIDYFDFQYYLQAAVNVMQGQVPYADFGFDYPPFAFIPIFLAFIPAILFNSVGVFVLSFQFLMVICDIVIVVCIYLIGLKLYSEKTAFIAAFLYATAFSVGYFVLTKYDAFPTCILMLAVLFTVYNRSIRGYIAIIAGILAKIFPGIAIPFVALYNAKSTSLRQEAISFLKIGIPVAVILFVPVLILKPGIILSYISGSLIRSAVYVNTATYTAYSYLHTVLNLGISVSEVSLLMYILMVLIVLFLFAIAYSEPEKDTRFLIKLLAVSIFVVVFCMAYHSPQYVVWYTPFVCLLVADSLPGILLFYTTQAITYIEFPLSFGTLYTNTAYTGAPGTSGWYCALALFTIDIVTYILLMYMAVKPTGTHFRMLLESLHGEMQKKTE